MVARGSSWHCAKHDRRAVQPQASPLTAAGRAMSETEPKKRGFFSKLFGLDQAEVRPPEPAPIPHPEPPAEPAAEIVPEAEPEAPLAPEILLGEDAPLPIVVAEPEPVQPKRSWWRRLRDGLSRTSSALTTGISDLFTKRKLDAATLEDLEDILIQADLGLATSARIAKAVGEGRYDKQIEPEEVKTILAREIETILTPVATPLAIDATKKPFVILMVGVNGSGKTTTIGKLAAKFRAEGKSVMLAAGDTFRAAAIEQLKVWGERTGAEVISGQQGADAAGLAFEALQKAKAGGTDVLLIDTAGRLQNKTGLMDELAKVVRVIRKLDPETPHAALLVLDATVGQNAVSQVEAFRDTAGVTGLVMTKLDGTARGGILVALAAQFGLPVHFIGVGESVDDLEPFSARDFARAVAGLGEAA
ncbi:signal recognition particle-docking protein FtsY [Bosea sp. Root483D1]|uniref:signal recognition particle-docking protein FtsY n=1 Tax=Bosea sp. Root483D1 TaxID=1736544 RepID=UPI0009EC7521